MANKQRQITLHFDENSQHIIDLAKRLAKSNFRTTEQQLLYILNTALERGDMVLAGEKQPEREALPFPDDITPELPSAEDIDNMAKEN